MWTGASDANGYGRLIVKRRPILAHRFSWALHYEPIPSGLYVCHRCDTPACVRPDHLFVGTQRDNARDCTRKSRWRPSRGETNGQAVLTAEQVAEIRHCYQTERTSYARLGRRFGVSQSMIGFIIQRHRWGHLA
jgi:hypothetical protein